MQTELFKTLRIEDLLSWIAPYKSIVLYGAGEYAQNVKEKLEQNDRNITFCIETQKQKTYMDNIPVYSLDECEEQVKTNNCIIIIAVSADKQTVIEGALISRQIHNYLKISDFFRQYADTAYYQNKTEQEYIQEIEKWYRDEKNLDITAQLQADIRTEKKDEKSIAFLVEFMEPRVTKMYEILKKTGYRITVLMSKNVEGQKDLVVSFLQKEANVHEFSCVEEAMYELMDSKVYLVHIFTSWLNCELATILLWQKQLFPKIVIERYDLTNGMYYARTGKTVQQFERTLGLERFCLEHADGVCFRCYAYEYLKEKLKFCFKGKTVRFLDYYQHQSARSCKTDDKQELSLCYAGGVCREKDDVGIPWACLMEFAEKCAYNHCHLHIYPAFWNERYWSDYLELEQKNPYFHFHKSVCFEMLHQEIAKYDYGIVPVKDDIFSYKKMGKILTNQKVIYAATNKLFDYICAGLPIIAVMPVKLIEELQEQGMVAYRWTIGQYNFDELRKNRRQLKERVLKNRDKFAIENRIGELIDFYRSL